MPSQWRPILHGEQAESALALARKIADELVARDADKTQGQWPVTLASGHAGIALLHAYLDACFPDEEHHRERALETVDQALAGIETILPSPALYGGYTGVAWALAHLEMSVWETGDVDDLQPLDEGLAELLSAGWTGTYDLISGLVGFGVYALDRPDSALMRATMLRILTLLEASAERPATRLDGSGGPDEADRLDDAPAGITWKTPPHLLPEHQRREAPDGYYNLGMAHGIPGIIALLAQVCMSPEPPPLARQLLRKSLDWLAYERLLPDRASFVSSWLLPGVPRSPSRTAWCYGDPGVALALVQAGLALKDPVVYRHGVEIGRRAAARDLHASRVRDAPLCHGAAGLAHVFNRLYQATAEATFLDSALRWLDQLMTMRQAGVGIAGYLSWTPRRVASENGQSATQSGGQSGALPELAWQATPGLLTGAAGIGLTLLAAATAVEPRWDRHMLCAVPPRGR